MLRGDERVQVAGQAREPAGRCRYTRLYHNLRRAGSLGWLGWLDQRLAHLCPLLGAKRTLQSNPLNVCL